MKTPQHQLNLDAIVGQRDKTLFGLIVKEIVQHYSSEFILEQPHIEKIHTISAGVYDVLVQKYSVKTASSLIEIMTSELLKEFNNDVFNATRDQANTIYELFAMFETKGSVH